MKKIDKKVIYTFVLIIVSLIIILIGKFLDGWSGVGFYIVAQLSSVVLYAIKISEQLNEY